MDPENINYIEQTYRHNQAVPQGLVKPSPQTLKTPEQARQKEPGLVEVLNELDGELAQLDQVVGVFTDRLQPLLTPEVESLIKDGAIGGETSPDVKSKAFGMVSWDVFHVERMRNDLLRLMNRLEL